MPDDTDTFDFDSSHLKGIINSNDDPFRCANCPRIFSHLNELNLTVCCGKAHCLDCEISSSKEQCPYCGSQRRARFTTVTKKNAKRGFPWAQDLLAGCYAQGYLGLNQSMFDALRWFRKAAAKGHPSAMLSLGSMYVKGTCCDRDLVMSEDLVLRGKDVCPCLEKRANLILVDIADKYRNKKQYDEAERILQPLVEGCMAEAFYTLAQARYERDLPNTTGTLQLFTEAAARAESLSTLQYEACDFALDLCMNLDRWAQARFWMRAVSSPTGKFTSCNDDEAKGVAGRISETVAKLREIRHSCAECDTPLYITNRKLCKQCKTYCYCSRACQKKHWNKKNGGHQEECMEVQALKERMNNSVASHKC